MSFILLLVLDILSKRSRVVFKRGLDGTQVLAHGHSSGLLRFHACLLFESLSQVIVKISLQNNLISEVCVERLVPRELTVSGEGQICEAIGESPRLDRLEKSCPNASPPMGREYIEFSKVRTVADKFEPREAHRLIIGSDGHPQCARTLGFGKKRYGCPCLE
jgi:hypothetical protein